MFNHQYNMHSVDTSSAEAPAAGKYTVVVDVVTDKISRTSGKDMLELKLKIVDAEDETNKKFKGRSLYYYIVDDQYADQKIYDVFSACGKPIPNQITGNLFTNLTGKVMVKNETYNGEKRATVNYWIRLAPGEAAPAPAETKNPADDLAF